ncbi:MAG TPA: sigma-70 family RNA polymerase sigma factor [Chitinophagaceae bacterium]|nr:sigma-70 family RNA polymerase sigma factor [Chitinophagaceae bacterium]
MMATDDKSLFTKAVLHHAEGLNRFALSLCHNEHNAEDLVAETVVKAYENYSGLKDHSKLKSWLYKILYNQFVSTYRKNSRMKQLDLIEEINDSFSLFEKLTATGTDDPEKKFLQKLTAASVQKAISVLPLLYKQALVLSDIEQFSYQEIATILKVPVGTVRSRIARARRQLEKTLWGLAVEMGMGNSKLNSQKPYVCTCGKEESVETIHKHEG